MYAAAIELLIPNESHNHTRRLLVSAQKTVKDCPGFRHRFYSQYGDGYFIHFRTKL